MQKIRFLFTSLLVFTFIVSCGSGDSSSSISSNVRTILAIGDSIGNGFGGTNPWPRLIQEQADVTVINNSQNGRQISDSVELVRESINTNNPSHVVIMLGTNDANNGSINSAISAMRQVIQETQAVGVQIIIATLPTIPADSDANSRARQLSAAYRSLGVPIAEVEAAFGDGSGLFLSDDFHPNNEGQQLIADAFINAL